VTCPPSARPLRERDLWLAATKRERENGS
jgi:hypothetical protein